MNTRILVIGLVIGFAALHCAPPPRPGELDDAQLIMAEAVDQQDIPTYAPELYSEAQQLYNKAEEAYQDRDLDEAVDYATRAKIKARSARELALRLKYEREIEELNQRVLAANQRQESAEQTLAKYNKRIERSERLKQYEQQGTKDKTKIALYEAKSAIDKAKMQLAEQYAKSGYEKAVLLYKQSQEAYSNGRFAEASQLAMQSEEAANAASDEAAPYYEAKKKEAKIDARNKEVLDKVQNIPAIDAEWEKQRIRIIMRDLFDSGSEEINNDRYSVLDTVASVLKEYPMYPVLIEGHTDNRGSKHINQALSEARAIAVRDYFVNKKNLPTLRFEAMGRADSMPLTSNNTAKGRAKNRRVEIILLFPETQKAN